MVNAPLPCEVYSLDGIEFLIIKIVTAEADMTRTGLWALLLVLTASIPLRAQNSEALNDIKAKIWEAQLVQRNFSGGLRHCNELNGTNFYFEQRDRVLNLQDTATRSIILQRRVDTIRKPGGPGLNRTPTPVGRRCRKTRLSTRRIAPQSRACLSWKRS
jgi:hypothetical protein